MTFDIILFTDATGLFYKQKTLGAWHIANMLRRKGYSVLVIDSFSRYIRDLSKLREILDRSMGSNTKLVGFSSTYFTYNLPETRRWDNWIDYYGLDVPDFWCGVPKSVVENLFDLLKEYSPDVKLLYGGTLATHYDALALMSPPLDFVVLGIGETQVSHVINHVFHGEKLRYRLARDMKTKVLDWDIKSLDFDFHHEGMIRYEPYDVILPDECLSLQTSRGCMYNCAFCSFPLRGRKRSDGDYHLNWLNLEEYFRRNYELWGTTRYQIVDDTFNETTEKLRMFKQTVKNSGVPIEWFSFMRVDLIDQEQIDIMAETNCRTIWIGIETLNPKALKGIDKKYDPELALNTINSVDQDTNARIYSSIMFGLEHDTVNDVRGWMQTMIDSPVACIGINPLGTNTRSPFTSSINKNPKKYGYEFDVSSRYELNWRNNTWKGEDAAMFAIEYQTMLWKSKRNLVSSYELMGLPFHGLDIDQLTKTAIADLPYPEIIRDYIAKFDVYHNELVKQLNQLC